MFPNEVKLGDGRVLLGAQQPGDSRIHQHLTTRPRQLLTTCVGTGTFGDGLASLPQTRSGLRSSIRVLTG